MTDDGASAAGGPASQPDWAALAFRPLVISGLVTCIAAGWVMSLEFFMPGWRGTYLAPLVAVVTLEMLLVEQQLRTRRLDIASRAQIRLGEMFIILLLLKPATYLERGWLAFLNDGQQWLREPVLFFDSDYIIGAMVMLLMWPLAMDLGGHLAALQDVFSPQDQDWALAGLKERFMLGAFVLLMAVGIRHVNFAALGLRLNLAQVNALTWLPLLYFGLGLLLFGQARLALLQAGWEREQISVTPSLTRRWAGWGALFVIGVTVLALLVPAGDTLLGFYLFTLLMVLVVFVGQLIFFVLLLLLSVLLSPCMALFKIQQVSTPAPPQLPTLQPPPPQSSGSTWFFYLRLIVFWVVVVVLLLLILRIYWRERKAAGGWQPWLGLVKLWHALWAWLRGWRNRVSLRFARAPQPTIPPPQEIGLGWWERWRARTARERVRRLYLALLQRAAQAGHPRRPDQTPFEYESALKSRVTGEENALDALTSAFVQARYSRRDFQPEEVSLLRRIWQRLQAKLRKQ
jgi:hypothetical protein